MLRPPNRFCHTRTVINQAVKDIVGRRKQQWWPCRLLDVEHVPGKPGAAMGTDA